MYWVFGLVCENCADHWLENGTDVLLQEFFGSGHFDNYFKDLFYIIYGSGVIKGRKVRRDELYICGNKLLIDEKNECMFDDCK